jgi:hypothetical protein
MTRPDRNGYSPRAVQDLARRAAAAGALGAFGLSAEELLTSTIYGFSVALLAYVISAFAGAGRHAARARPGGGDVPGVPGQVRDDEGVHHHDDRIYDCAMYGASITSIRVRRPRS